MATTVHVSSSELGPHVIDLSEQDMRDVGDFLVRRIRTRTEAGQSVYGYPLKAYSKSYAAEKKKYLGHARVDLTVSGGMLNGMQVTSATKNSAVISFTSQGTGAASGGTFIQRSAATGAAQKAAYNDPTRNFFGASPADEQAIAEALDRVLSERFAKE